MSISVLNNFGVQFCPRAGTQACPNTVPVELVKSLSTKILDQLAEHWQMASIQENVPLPNLQVVPMEVVQRCFEKNVSLAAPYIRCFGIDCEEERCAVIGWCAMRYGVDKMAPYLSLFTISDPELLQRLLTWWIEREPLLVAKQLRGLPPQSRLEAMKMCIAHDYRAYDEVVTMITDPRVKEELTILKEMARYFATGSTLSPVSQEQLSEFYAPEGAVSPFLTQRLQEGELIYQWMARYVGMVHERVTRNKLISPAQDRVLSQLMKLMYWKQVDSAWHQLLFGMERILTNPKITPLWQEERSSTQRTTLLALFMDMSREKEVSGLDEMKRCVACVRKELKDGTTGLMGYCVTVLLALGYQPTIPSAQPLHLLFGLSLRQTSKTVIERFRLLVLMVNHLGNHRLSALLLVGRYTWSRQELYDLIWGWIEKKMGEGEGYEALRASQRRPVALERYFFKIHSKGNEEAMRNVNRLMKRVLKGTFQQERYRIVEGSHLEALAQQCRAVWGPWQCCPPWKDLEENRKVGISDDWQDLLLMGTEVTTCLHEDAHIRTAQTLLSACLDGKIQCVVVKKKEDEKILARAVLKLLFKKGQGQDMPVLYLGRIYQKEGIEHSAEIVRVAVERAQQLGVPVYRQAENVASLEVAQLYSLSSCAPEYEDALTIVIPRVSETGEYTILGTRVLG